MKKDDLMIAWHGTNQNFDRFDLDCLGLSNPNAASREAIFFSKTRAVAESYARSTARKLVTDHFAHEARVKALLEATNKATREGRHDRYENLVAHLEKIDGDVVAAPPAGARALLCALDVSRVMEIDGNADMVRWDLATVLKSAKYRGHDAVILRGMADTPEGASLADDHIAVFDPDRIRILARFDVDMEPVATCDNDISLEEEDASPCP
jgi:hypothetical protein